ncbi:MAG TPA: DPP IV N-terminal domain-containing protein [Gemmatimonadales bacterium]|jgi:dipeptidyl-peptidase-4
MTLMAGALVVGAAVSAQAQDRLKAMPGYDEYAKMQCEYQGTMQSGAVALGGGGGRGGFAGGGRGGGACTPAPVLASQPLVWSADGRGVDYSTGGKRMHFDFASRKATEVAANPSAEPAGAAAAGRGGRGGGRGGRGGGAGSQTDCQGAAVPAPERGRQSPVSASPDGKLLANYRDRNLYVCSEGNPSSMVAISTDGSEKDRIKYGTASWVYGEELAQTTAMWWNPESTKLAYFRFDESKVPDFYITQDETKLQTKVDVEAYPKPGVPNPVVDLYVYDVATKHSVHIDVRDGKPFSNDVVGHYVYDMSWTPDGKSLIIHRTNRRQDILELAICSPETGACKAIIHEEWLTGWVENHPPMRYLADSTRFLWQSERNGFKNYYLYNLSGQLLATVTNNQFEAIGISRIDEKTNTLWYTARDGDNFMKTQLHKVSLDGKGDRRLTDPAFTHQDDISPDGKYFVDVEQTHDQPPVTHLVDVATGKPVAELAKSDISVMEQRHIHKAEMFTYLAADGKTKLYGELEFPSTFDPNKKYPLLMSVYGGPGAGNTVPTENFSTGSPTTEYGFVTVLLTSRAVPGMGKRTLDDVYLKLGQTEMDDMANGIKSLWDRSWMDKERVGIYGTSYGGYTSVMEILRHPEVFTVASSSSPPTDWRNYDTIYTERYMWIPQENADGYDKGSAMTYVNNLTGRLMLDYGTIDNNVHNTNMMQLIQALQHTPGGGKSFELQVQPDVGHSGVNNQRMMEFFIENLIQHPERIHEGYDAKAMQ